MSNLDKTIMIQKSRSHLPLSHKVDLSGGDKKIYPIPVTILLWTGIQHSLIMEVLGAHNKQLFISH